MLRALLQRVFAEEAVAVRLPSGRMVWVNAETPEAAAIWVRLEGRDTPVRLLAHPTLALPELYMEGRLRFERGSLQDLLFAIGRNLRRRPLALKGLAAPPLRWLARMIYSANGLVQAARNVQRHYDLPLELYQRFLDPDLHYSCAYFRHPRMSLEAAQAAKVRHIAAKLLVGRGHSVLDIGCGWGGLARALARDHGAQVTGVTVSKPQRDYARARARAEALTTQARFELQDYRAVRGRFDRIVSVGMLEHVGRPNFRTFFAKLAALLAPDGVALVHTIGRAGTPLSTNAFVRKHIFPGGYIPALSELMPAIERSGLVLADGEVLRLHYAETLRHWRERFLASPLPAGLDERFRRKWEYYLASSEAGFRHGELVVFQLQLCHRLDAVPLTRDYVTDADDAGPPAEARARACGRIVTGAGADLA